VPIPEIGKMFENKAFASKRNDKIAAPNLASGTIWLKYSCVCCRWHDVGAVVHARLRDEVRSDGHFQGSRAPVIGTRKLESAGWIKASGFADIDSEIRALNRASTTLIYDATKNTDQRQNNGQKWLLHNDRLSKIRTARCSCTAAQAGVTQGMWQPQHYGSLAWAMARANLTHANWSRSWPNSAKLVSPIHATC
jgi:hypothetical protein